MHAQIVIDPQWISRFCQRNHIERLSLFGSVLRPDFSDDSDVDILVEFQQGVPVTFLDMFDMEQELSHYLGRKVDLRTPSELSRHFREEVERSALTQYAA